MFKHKKQKKQKKKLKLKTKTTYEANRRISTEDRREFGPAANFPLVDSDGKTVKQDRRTRPDRRINSIVVQENHIRINKNF